MSRKGGSQWSKSRNKVRLIFLEVKMHQDVYTWRCQGLNCMSQGPANVFRAFETRSKVWFMFLVSKPQRERFD